MQLAIIFALVFFQNNDYLPDVGCLVSGVAYYHPGEKTHRHIEAKGITVYYAFGAHKGVGNFGSIIWGKDCTNTSDPEGLFHGYFPEKGGPVISILHRFGESGNDCGDKGRRGRFYSNIVHQKTEKAKVRHFKTKFALHPTYKRFKDSESVKKQLIESFLVQTSFLSESEKTQELIRQSLHKEGRVIISCASNTLTENELQLIRADLLSTFPKLVRLCHVSRLYSSAS